MFQNNSNSHHILNYVKSANDGKGLKIIIETIFTKFQSDSELINLLILQIFNNVCNGSFESKTALFWLVKNYNNCIDQFLNHLSMWPYTTSEVPSLLSLTIKTLHNHNNNLYRNIKIDELDKKIIAGPQVIFTLIYVLFIILIL